MESKKQYNERYYQVNKKAIQTQQKAYRSLHKKEIGEYMSEYSATNPKYKQKGLARLHKWSKSEKGKLYRNKVRKNNIKFINQYKISMGCLNPNCKWSGEYSASMLDFHHKNSTEKKFNLGMSHTRSKETILKEMAKCTLICSNCHRQVTHEKLDASVFPSCLPLNSIELKMEYHGNQKLQTI